MIAIPPALLLGVLALYAASLIGWSLEVDASAMDRVRDDAGLLALSAVAGGAAGALLVWGVTNGKLTILGGVLVGVAPAALKASAFFTYAY